MIVRGGNRVGKRCSLHVGRVCRSLWDGTSAAIHTKHPSVLTEELDQNLL